MYSKAFTYHSPETIEEAIRLLGRYGPEAKLLAGGHSLIPIIKLRLASPAHLVDLQKLRSELQYIRDEEGTVTIGALTTHWMLESSELLQENIPLVSETARSIGDVQVRNMGTIGGSLAHADPTADYPATVLALEAELVAQGTQGRRSIPADDFFAGFFTTALAPDEVLVEVRVPALPERTGGCYLKFPHPASGFAVCGVAVLATRGEQGECARCRVGITGISDQVYRATAVEQLMEGGAFSAERVEQAAQHAADGVELLEDHFASAEYRIQLAEVYVKRALLAAWARIE